MLFFLTILLQAQADQCAWNNSSVAQNAKDILKEGMAFRDWCEPCGEQEPSNIQVIQKISWSQPDPKYHQVTINGEDKDLAYLFVQIDDAFVNVGIKARCNPTSVSPKINFSEINTGKGKEKTHCQNGEEVIFSCKTESKGKTVSLCAKKNITSLQYRFGNLGNIEFYHPQSKKQSLAQFDFQQQQTIRSLETAVQFSNKDTKYSIVSRSGSSLPEEAEYNNFSGIEITLPSQQIISIRCAEEPVDNLFRLQNIEQQK